MNGADFEERGFAIVPGVMTPEGCAVAAEWAGRSRAAVGGAGSRRLLAEGWCRELADAVRRHPGVAGVVPGAHVAVQCTAFEKSRVRNWLVPAHQDVTIPVQARVEHPAWGPYSEKEGGLFVRAPRAVLESLVAVRLHLDRCGPEDGPLRVVPGSHRLGVIPADAAGSVREEGREVVCPCDRGAALLMRPLLVHASSKAAGTGRRRVLHFVFGPPELPDGLRWPHTKALGRSPEGRVSG